MVYAAPAPRRKFDPAAEPRKAPPAQRPKPPTAATEPQPVAPEASFRQPWGAMLNTLSLPTAATSDQPGAGKIRAQALPLPAAAKLPVRPIVAPPSVVQREAAKSSEGSGGRTEGSSVSQGLSLQAQPNRTGLPDTLKTGLEHLSGYSLDQVKVHYNSAKPAQMQAHAYTQGTDIFVSPGQERHVPHEGWHVVQQMQGRVKATRQLKGVGLNDDQGLEREADVMGGRAQSILQSKNRKVQVGENPETQFVRTINGVNQTRGVVQKHPGWDNLLHVHGALDHKEYHDQALHERLAGEEKKSRTRQDNQGFRTQTRFSATTINWQGILHIDSTDDHSIMHEEYHVEDSKVGWGDGQGVSGKVHYLGVDPDGKNHGVQAVVTSKMCSYFKQQGEDNVGESATGDIPYIKHGFSSGVHRAHVLARCLGGLGSRLNWVVFSSTANVSTMWSGVEKLVYGFLKERGSWCAIKVTPVYNDKLGPVPLGMLWECSYFNYGDLVDYDKTFIPNDV